MLQSSQSSKPSSDPLTGIHEIQNIKEALSFIKEDSCLIYDLDKTIFDTAQYLGGDNWFRDHLSGHVKEGKSFKDALHLTLPIYLEVQKKSKVEPVEENTVQLIADLQKKHTSFALTSRDGQLSEATLSQLKSLGLSFNQDLFENQRLEINAQEHQELLGGVIFCAGGRNKGMCLEKVFEHLDWKPKHIVFIDDVRDYLANVEKMAEKHDITFTGLRYGYADVRPQSHNDKVAQKQLELYQNPLRSDEEAIALIRAQTRKDCGVVIQADRQYGLIWAAEKQNYEAICQVLNQDDKNTKNYKQYRKKAKFYNLEGHDELCTRFKVPLDQLNNHVMPELKKLGLISDLQIKYLEVPTPQQDERDSSITPMFDRQKQGTKGPTAKPISKGPVTRSMKKQ